MIGALSLQYFGGFVNSNVNNLVLRGVFGNADETEHLTFVHF